MYVSQCISDNTDKGDDVQWKSLMKIAYAIGYLEIVRCIQASGRITLLEQLTSACGYDNLTFVSQCIVNNTDMDHIHILE